MTDLAARLAQANAIAFSALGLDPAYAVVQRSDRSELADFQCNGAMAVAKQVGRPTRQIATAIAQHWTQTHLADPPVVAGLGFLNFQVRPEALAARAQELVEAPRCGAGFVGTPRRVIIDYGGPNVAKPMHVGHLRSSIIGESLKRLFRFRGDEVWGDAHLGDWGFQMGLLIVAFAEEIGGLADPGRCEARLATLTLDDLERMYPAAAARAREEEMFRDRARRATLELQSGEPAHRKIWQAMRDISIAALRRDFGTLGIDFDFWKGESDADACIAEMMEALEAQSLLELHEGAQVVRVARTSDQRPLPPLLITSSEGAAMYGTTDLATILQRRRDLAPQLTLYVVDQRQADHFVQVFRVAESAGLAQPGSLEHIGFGTVNGSDGKPFKTRAGGVLKLSELIAMARDRAQQRLREAKIGEGLGEAEFADVAQKVAVAAVKFADLVNFRGTSYMFDLDRFISFEGKTGPYLLYAAVRIKSLLRKAAEQGIPVGRVVVAHAAERELTLILDAFDAVLRSAYERRAPHLLAEHAFTLAQTFSRFYGSCPILPEADAAIRSSRLALAVVTLRQLELELGLLGLEAPDRM